MIAQCRRAHRPFKTESCCTLQLSDGRLLGYSIYGVNVQDRERKRPSSRRPFVLVLYFHGIGGSRREVIDIEGARELKDSNICWVGVDRPGIGLSTRHPTRRLMDWPRDIAQLLTHLQIERSQCISLIGFSSGAPYVHACVHYFGSRIISAHTIGAQGPYSQYTPTQRIKEFRDGGYRGLYRLNYAMKQPFLSLIAVAYYQYLKWKFFRNPKQTTHSYFGGRLCATHNDTRQMLEENLRTCLTAPFAVSSLVFDLNLPNDEWGFDLSQLKVT